MSQARGQWGLDPGREQADEGAELGLPGEQVGPMELCSDAVMFKGDWGCGYGFESFDLFINWRIKEVLAARIH